MKNETNGTEPATVRVVAHLTNYPHSVPPGTRTETYPGATVLIKALTRARQESKLGFRGKTEANSRLSHDTALKTYICVASNHKLHSCRSGNITSPCI